jgi:hypothetical protein
MTLEESLMNVGFLQAERKVADTMLDIFLDAAFEADQQLVLATPVRTGRARSNWIASFNIPSDEVRGPLEVSAALSQNMPTIATAKLGDIIYLSNNLPYIGSLNDGSSAQAPAGFVQKVEAAVKASVKMRSMTLGV